MNLKSCKTVEQIQKFLKSKQLFTNSWNHEYGYNGKCRRIDSDDILVVINESGVQWINLSSGLHNYCECGNVNVKDSFDDEDVFDNEAECEQSFKGE